MSGDFGRTDSSNPGMGNHGLLLSLTGIALLTTGVAAGLTEQWWQGLLLGLISGGASLLVTFLGLPKPEPEPIGIQAPPSNPWLDFSNTLRDLLGGVVPLWHSHVGIARDQAGEAADQLVVRFAGI